MASDEKSTPPPKSSAKAVNRGGRPRKFPPGEAKDCKAAAQKQNRGPKASRPVPGTFQFIPYEPPGTESSLSQPVPTVKNEQELHGTTSEAASVHPARRLQSAPAITPPAHPAWEDLPPIGAIASVATGLLSERPRVEPWMRGPSISEGPWKVSCQLSES